MRAARLPRRLGHSARGEENPSERRSPRPDTRYCGSGLPGPYRFPARIEPFQAFAAPIPGQQNSQASVNPSPAKRDRTRAKSQVRVENAEWRALIGGREVRRLPIPLTWRGFAAPSSPASRARGLPHFTAWKTGQHGLRRHNAHGRSAARQIDDRLFQSGLRRLAPRAAPRPIACKRGMASTEPDTRPSPSVATLEQIWNTRSRLSSNCFAERVWNYSARPGGGARRKDRREGNSPSRHYQARGGEAAR